MKFLLSLEPLVQQIMIAVTLLSVAAKEFVYQAIFAIKDRKFLQIFAIITLNVCQDAAQMLLAQL
jgi:hypothetical protein